MIPLGGHVLVARQTSQVFDMCHVRTFNLMYESLTSHAVREKLNNLKVEDPQFWDELRLRS